MNTIKCRIQDCPSTFETEELVLPGATFTCTGRGKDGFPIPGHSRKELVQAQGRVFNSKKDEKDMDISFQDHQFDYELRGKRGFKGNG